VATSTNGERWVSPAAVLDREVYSEAEAARLLEVAPSTLHYWLEGGVRRGVTYRPVVRPEPKGRAFVTWGEFVEAGLLREYRDRDIPLQKLRVFITVLRDRMGIPYPLAHERPWVAGAELVMQAQAEADLDRSDWLVWDTRQGLLTAVAERFVERIEWAGEVAGTYRPHDDEHSLVRVDPGIRFGRPQVGGITTSAIAEQDEDGVTAEELAESFGITVEQVNWALAYERTRVA
jgi:uncharacterized protein (DUF433 family)